LAKKKAKSKTKKSVSFEQSLEQLQEVVSELENGNLSLTDSLDKYEQGVANLKQCYEALNSAQKRIEVLVDLDEEGNLVTRPFDNTSSMEMTEGVRRSTSETNEKLRSELSVDDDEDEHEDDEGEDESEFEDEGEFDDEDPDSLF
jgi:exodeoxyribonuclease VII small subunit